jgi:hypothetical protein
LLLPAAAAATLTLHYHSRQPPTHPSHIHSQPAIPKVSRRLPASHRIRPKLQSTPDQTPDPRPPAHPSLASLCLLPSRGPPRPRIFYVGRRRATPCALGNHLRTTCGTCRPSLRGTSRLGRRSGPQCAGQTEYQSLDELPDHTHAPTKQPLSTLPSTARPRPLLLLLLLYRPKDEPENAHSLNSQLCSPKPNATRRCHCFPACCCCCCFFPPHLTSLPHLTQSMC